MHNTFFSVATFDYLKEYNVWHLWWDKIHKYENNNNACEGVGKYNEFIIEDKVWKISQNDTC